jgi:hypothetical protein
MNDGLSNWMICFICQITKIIIDQHNSGQIIILARILVFILEIILHYILKRKIFDFKKKYFYRTAIT